MVHAMTGGTLRSPRRGAAEPEPECVRVRRGGQGSGAHAAGPCACTAQSASSRDWSSRSQWFFAPKSCSAVGRKGGVMCVLGVLFVCDAWQVCVCVCSWQPRHGEGATRRPAYGHTRPGG